MAFEKVIIFISLLLVSSVYPYSLDISASLRWGEVRDNMLCFLRLSEQNIGGVINARRVRENKNFSTKIKSTKYCTFFHRELGIKFAKLIAVQTQPLEK